MPSAEKPNPNVRATRQKLAYALVALYLEKEKESHFNQDSLNALRQYLWLVNDGKTELKKTDHFFKTEGFDLSKIKQYQARYQKAAEAKAKSTAFKDCLQTIAYGLAASVLPSFILAAGIFTAKAHIATIAAVLFFIIIGSLSLLGTQAYIWFHHEDKKPSRYGMVKQRFGQFYNQTFTQEEGPAIYKDTHLESVLMGHMDISELKP